MLIKLLTRWKIILRTMNKKKYYKHLIVPFYSILLGGCYSGNDESARIDSKPNYVKNDSINNNVKDDSINKDVKKILVDFEKRNSWPTAN